ncbi:MAG: putative toxin-antitoxin system toxin component, PIN family [Rhodocyclaceae bacterium]|jgi:putative PIN family toxin of toxin-antitoxin system|nr:putative toxin-antitoxin system toxin component, PIN family [Rhodocyclaceae bacterium]MCL4758416.1 putative toxin-antitoxin system toxin component, PIN family [Rhodocyclaceae bacterium]
MTDAPRTTLVLDTNTVMALWVFEDPALAKLRARIEADDFVLASRSDALEELRRVLAYRQFALEPGRQHALLEHYAARCALLAPAPADAPALPECRDSDDQKFLEIARDAQADQLVTRDKALLRLNRHRQVRPLFEILTPERLCASFD